MKKYFFTGLVTLLPLAVTVWVVNFVIRLLTKPFVGMVLLLTDHLPAHWQNVVRMLSHLIVLVFIFLLILFLGFVARKFFFNQMIRLGDRLMIKIPLLNKIYHTSKEIVKALFGSKGNSFEQVVLLPFPNSKCYCVGLITKQAPKTCSAAQGEELVSIFIPTTPNPTTGFLVMTNRSHLIHLNMKSDEAIKYVVSCAVVQPGKHS